MAKKGSFFAQFLKAFESILFTPGGYACTVAISIHLAYLADATFSEMIGTVIMVLFFLWSYQTVRQKGFTRYSEILAEIFMLPIQIFSGVASDIVSTPRTMPVKVRKPSRFRLWLGARTSLQWTTFRMFLYTLYLLAVTLFFLPYFNRIDTPPYLELKEFAKIPEWYTYLFLPALVMIVDVPLTLIGLILSALDRTIVIRLIFSR
jgi:hypothetical protein